jgi:hypothetical protein
MLNQSLLNNDTNQSGEVEFNMIKDVEEIKDGAKNVLEA